MADVKEVKVVALRNIISNTRVVKGHEYSLPEKEAAKWVNAGYAQYVEAPKPEKKVEKKEEKPVVEEKK